MITTHIVQSVVFDNDFMYLTIDNKTVKIKIEKASEKLKAASDFQRGFYKISPSGYGIHWALIDEDLAVDNLLKISE